MFPRALRIALLSLALGGGIDSTRAAAQAATATAATKAAEPPTKVRPSVRLELDSAAATLAGQFLSVTTWQEVKFEKSVSGRYFCLESLSAQDGRPYAAVAELELLDPQGRLLPRRGWRIAYADSEEHDLENGSAEQAVDGNPATFWHTQWSNCSPNHPHHLVLDLGASCALGGFRYLPRPGGGNVGGRIRDYRVYVGDNLLEATPPEKALPDKFYLLAYFTGTGDAGLQLAYSLNGYRWDVLNHGNSFLKPKPGASVLRDPCLAEGPDGTFHLVWTAAWTGNYIGYASSRDLVHWSEPALLPVMTNAPATLNCWAPEIFWNAPRRQFLVFWASTVTNRFGGGNATTNNRIYCATTADFKSFSASRLFYDPGFDVLDATLFPANGRYYLVFRDGGLGRVRTAAAWTPDGPFTRPGPVIEANGAEGPMLFRLADQTVVLYHASGDRCGAVKSPDMEHWEDLSAGMVLPRGCQQGSVLELPGTRLRPFLQEGLLEIGSGPAASELGLGDWIWTTNLTDRQACRFWRTFDVPSTPPATHALLYLTADNSYNVYLDGRQIGRGSDPNSLTEYDLTLVMSPGRHVLAVEAFNDAFDAGMILGLRVKFASGKGLGVFSDSSWRIAPNSDRAWLRHKEAGRGWPAARVVAYAGAAWWQYPGQIIQSPPVEPSVFRFWQQAWVLAVLLFACLTVAVLWLRQGLRLAWQARAKRLLDRERARIARDMHDDLGGGLTQLTLLGELALRETPLEGEAHARLSQLCAKARLLLRSMDEIIWVVNPRRDTVKDFAAFISERTQEFLDSCSIRCRQEVAEELPALPLDLPQRRNLLLAVKEAVRNAAQHSGANEVHLKIHVVDNFLKVVVADNGRGFSPARPNPDRNGLANMNQRLADIGGTFSLDAAPAKGCCVVFWLPLTARQSPAQHRRE